MLMGSFRGALRVQKKSRCGCGLPSLEHTVACVHMLTFLRSKIEPLGADPCSPAREGNNICKSLGDALH